MFVGRANELSQLENLFLRDGKKALMLYGKRRVGKSALILEAINNVNCKTIYYECLMTTVGNNLQNLEKKLQELFHNKYLHFESFEEVFEFLGTLDEKIIVVLDEYSYLKVISEKYYIDSLFQRIIDQMKDNITLVLLGSYVGMMKELLEKENPLFGRFSLIMNVKAFDYLDSSLFYPNTTAKSKVEFYSIFGGSPFSNSFITPDDTLKQNIIRLILNPFGILHSYVENTLLSELSKISNANLILSALSNGKMRYTELESFLNLKSNGILDKQLKNLIEMEILSKVTPVNKKGDRKKTFYEISDNLVRFYYRYIYGNKDTLVRIGEEAFYEHYIKPTLTTFISHRFEGISLEYFSRLSRLYPNAEILDIGTLWYDIPREHKNGEFDCVLQHKDSYSIYEVKYYDAPLQYEIVKKELEQIRDLSAFLQVKNVGFICLSGFDFQDDTLNLIDGNMLYHFENKPF